MDIEKCKECRYYCENLLTEEHICSRNYITEGVFEKCKYIVNCPFFKKKKPVYRQWGHYELPEHLNCEYDINIKLGDDIMRNDNFETRLTSYNEVKSRVISSVKIDCENFDTFKQIIEAIMPILEKEDVKEYSNK